MNLAKFLKGSTTIGELMNMPNIYLHTIYKEYVDSITSKEGRKQIEVEQVEDEIEEAIIGG